MSVKGGKCFGDSPWHDRAVRPPGALLKAMANCPPHCRMPEAVFSRGKPANFLAYPPLQSNPTKRNERQACIAQQASMREPEPAREDEMPQMEVYSYEREEVYDPSDDRDANAPEPIYGVYEDDNQNNEGLELHGSCHTMEVYGESEEELEDDRGHNQFESIQEQDEGQSSDEGESSDEDRSADENNNNENEDDEEETEEETEEEEPEEWEREETVSVPEELDRLPPLTFDPINPGMITLLEYSNNPERIPNTPFTEVEFIDEEYRNAKHMAKNYHKFLRDIQKEMEISLKPHPNYETPWKAIAGAFNTKRVDIFSEYRLAYIFQRFGRNCLIEGSPYEEGLFEFGEAFAISASLKETLQSDVTAAYIKPLEHFMVKEWPELMMHDQHVESLAKKLRKAMVDPKKLKEKDNGAKDKKNGKAKNTNANAKNKAESPEAGAGAGAEDIEASIQEKLHKSEVARLRKAFSEQRNNTLSLFQFFLTSEYSQLVKLMELSECHLEYHRESYDLYKQVIESLRAKINTIRPPRDDRLMVVDLALDQEPPMDKRDQPREKGDQPREKGEPPKTKPGMSQTNGQPLRDDVPAEPTTQDRPTSMGSKKIKEKSQHAAEIPNQPAVTRAPKQMRDANTGTPHPRKARPEKPPPPPTHQCDCPTNQLLFLPTVPNVSSFGTPPPKQRKQEEERRAPKRERTPPRQPSPDKMEKAPKASVQRDAEPPHYRLSSDDDDAIKYVVCGGKCPGCMDASFYEPRDRYADRKRDKPEFKDFKIKIPPIGATYEEFDDDLDDKSCRPLPCRGPDHVTNGPCTCEKEIAYRSRNKKEATSFFDYLKTMQRVKPYGFIKQDIPDDTFADGYRVDVGDMVDLLRKTKDGNYEVRLNDGTERTGRIKADAIHVIEEPREDNYCRSRKDVTSANAKSEKDAD